MRLILSILLLSVCYPCDEGYSEIDGECYYQSDLDVLQIFIDNSSETINMDLDIDSSGIIEPLELGDQVWTLGRLTSLDLNNSELSGVIPSVIGTLTNLTALSLFSNQLSGEIPESICNNYPSLNYFSIGSNQLCPPYPDCLTEEDIGYQDTSECSFCDEGYTEIDGECYYQSDLDVLQDFIDLNESLNGLEPLDITGINWTEGHLTNFFFYDIGITIVPQSIGDLDSLRQVFFFDNEINSIPESIGDLIKLTFIDFGRNNISQIPETIWDLEDLTVLNFQENQLTSISNQVCDIYPNLLYEPFLIGNQICPPYPECLTEENLGYQDISECIECNDVIGDTNDDGQVDIRDIVLIMNFIFSDEYDYCSDLNDDGGLNILDLKIMIDIILFYY